MKLRLVGKLSLRWKIILGGVAAVVVPCVVVGVVLYETLSRSLIDIYHERSVQVAKDLAALVDTTLRQELQYVSALALDPVIADALDSGNYAGVQRKLAALQTGLPSANYSYFLADKNGIIQARAASRVSIGSDLHKREYFERAREGQASISRPAPGGLSETSDGTDGGIVLAVAPVRGEEGFRGILVAAIHASRFKDVVSSIRSGKTGYAFLVDSNGLFVVHPGPRLIMKPLIGDTPGMRSFAERMLRGETGSAEYVFVRTRKIAGFAPIEVAGWHAAFTQDRAEILAPLNSVFVICFLSGIAFLALAVGFLFAISPGISTPVERMMDMLRGVTAGSEDLILSIGNDRRIGFANPAAEKALGRPARDIVGTEPVLTNLQNIPTEQIWTRLEAGETWHGHVQVGRDASTPRTFATIVLPVRDRGRVIRSYLEIAKDVTNELALEARLRQSQKMEALGSLAGGIAHDFNNILSCIAGFSELSLSADDNPEERRGYAREILGAVDRARDLTRQVLLFSRQTKLELKAVRLTPVVTEALRLTRASVPPSIEVRSVLDSDAVVMAEPTQIHQVIVNLCVNAAHALKDMTGFVEVALEDRHVDEDQARLHPGLQQGRHVCLRVSDSGRGIDPAIIDRIFEPFFTTKPQGEGTGLGLSVVHGIVKGMNGTISVRSELGRGTSFDILIPVADAAEAAAVRMDSIPERGAERVLVVDDERAIVKVVSANLGALGYVVSAFSDSREALAAFSRDSQGFDLLVIDNLMPHMDGFLLAGRVREIRSDIPIVLCSGYFGPDAEARARAAGIQALLHKPLRTDELSAAIRRALAARRSA